MKIVHICQYYNDGYGYQENLLPRYQKKLGYNVIVITSDRMSYFTKEKKAKIVGEGLFEDDGIPIIRLPIKSEFKGRYVRFVNLERELEKEKPDYIFHHGLTSPSLISCSKHKRKNPSVFFAADNHADYHNSSQYFIWKYLFYKLIWKNKINKILKDIDMFYSVTQGCKDFAEKELGIPEEKHILLYLGADINNYYFDENWKKIIRKKYNITEDDFVIVSAGKFDKKKKIESVINSIKEINKLNLKLLLIGSFEKEYEKYIDSLINNDSRIIKTGWIESKDLFKFFSAADLAVFPGSQSAIWQQAISCELPVILKYWPESDYLIDNNGYFLFSFNYKEIIQYIKIILNDKCLFINMRKNAKKVSSNILSYKIIAKKTIKAYYEAK